MGLAIQRSIGGSATAAMTQTSHALESDRSDAGQGQTLMFSTANDLPEGTRQEVVRALNRSLADTTDLTTQMKVAHWNVKGIHFYQLHLLFDEVAELLAGHADLLAERATALGGRARGTIRSAVRDTRIPELDHTAVTGEEFLQATVDNLAVHAANLRSDIDFAAECGDEDTADLYTELSREVDQQLYFLESHLQTRPVDAIGRTESPQQGAPPSSPGGGYPPTGELRGSGAGHRGSVDTGSTNRQSGGRQTPQRATFGGPAGGNQSSPGHY